jgi:hypothetical protein
MSKRSTNHGDGHYSGGSLTAAVRFTKELPRRIRRREFPGQIVIIDLLEQIDRSRERESILAQDFKSMLETGYPGPDRVCYSISSGELPKLQRAWADFSVQGGVTADDFKAFIRGEKIGTVNVITRRHLRLIHSKKGDGGKVVRFRPRRDLDDHNPDAA